jgi:hypothetical protein
MKKTIVAKRSKAKVQNTSSVDITGKAIPAPIAKWRQSNPDALEFDSKLEWNCYMMLKESGIRFIFKPDPIVYFEKSQFRVLAHTPEVESALNRDKRDAVCKADKTMYTRMYNKKFRKVLRPKTINQATWSPDFCLPDHDMYVEAKGYANDAFPIKFKVCRALLAEIGREAIEVGTMKEMEDLIIFLKSQ